MIYICFNTLNSHSSAPGTRSARPWKAHITDKHPNSSTGSYVLRSCYHSGDDLQEVEERERAETAGDRDCEGCDSDALDEEGHC